MRFAQLFLLASAAVRGAVAECKAVPDWCSSPEQEAGTPYGYACLGTAEADLSPCLQTCRDAGTVVDADDFTLKDMRCCKSPC
ncbi:hypothetical protein QTJ16_002493 [Diplocarpon rosae]|uniref:Plethodontid modulating factor n=1 Tax=Diplocarpon rosae TaxID=946125 RepID=A0AAD9T3A7_9HELO|nr:hypothetical protein QTJ16_002493 [Diplocarpon rosae]